MELDVFRRQVCTGYGHGLTGFTRVVETQQRTGMRGRAQWLADRASLKSLP